MHMWVLNWKYVATYNIIMYVTYTNINIFKLNILSIYNSYNKM